MPDLRPFHGIRYSSTEDLPDLVCPPYDVISKDEQHRLHESHPHNAVHLELARGAGDAPSRYREAAATFERWLADGILVQETKPSLYIYRQDFTAPDGTRRRVAGVLGALALEDYSAGGVLPHERTMPGPIEDRLALLDACPVNISPIYAIYRGAGGLAPYLDSLTHRPPEVRIVDGAGTLHRLWVVSAPAEVAMLAEAVAPGPLVIADGHHRYETALAYRQARQGTPGEHDSVMCFCVDADAEDLVVLPYHRILRTVASDEEITAGLTARFRTRPARDLPGDPLESSTADHAFVFVLQDASLLVEVSAAEVARRLPDRHPVWRGLDVVALHEVVLPEVLEGGPEELRFTRDAHEVSGMVADGWTAGVLLRPVGAAEVVEVARSGERMPQKASYFWPKAITGLVFRSLR